VAHLYQVWVAPGHRGRGIGRMLIEAVIAWARESGLRVLLLDVTAGNSAAVELYRQLGFVDDGDTQPLRDKLPSNGVDPAAAFERLALRRAVGKAVSSLPARERLIVSSFYAGDISLRQIGDHLGISKQRVSQLHGRALVGLRAALAGYDEQ